MNIKKISIIGSYRRNIDIMTNIKEKLNSFDVSVVLPISGNVIDRNEKFVRLEENNTSLDDFAIQNDAIKAILESDAIYVVCHNGYIGNTTCYEIGWIASNKKPIAFSEMPIDLPICIDDKYIMDEVVFFNKLKNDKLVPINIDCCICNMKGVGKKCKKE